MSGVRERKQQETRAGILQAAKELFLEKGYGSTTMEQIAEQAIVGAGTLYNYFASKDDIFLSVMSNEILRNVDQDLTEDDIGESGVEEALCKYLEKFINAFKLFRKSLWQDAMSMIFSKSGSSLFMQWLAFDMGLIISLEHTFRK